MFKKIFITLIGVMFIFGMSGLAFAMMCEGMGGEHESKHVQAQNVEEQSGAINIGNKICPVSGEKIDEKTKATYEYEGKIYNFCCPMCIEEFKKDPEKYIKKVEEELKKESKGEAQGETGVSAPTQESPSMHKGHMH